MLINEITATPYSYTTSYDAANSTLSARFKTKAGDTITSRLVYTDEDSAVGLGFRRNDNFEMTGEGDQFRILFTIVDFLKNNIGNMFQKHDPDIFYFSGDNSEPSRVKLYRKRACPIISSILGSEWNGPEEKNFTHTDGDSEMVFSWRKKKPTTD